MTPLSCWLRDLCPLTLGSRELQTLQQCCNLQDLKFEIFFGFLSQKFHYLYFSQISNIVFRRATTRFPGCILLGKSVLKHQFQKFSQLDFFFLRKSNIKKKKCMKFCLDKFPTERPNLLPPSPTSTDPQNRRGKK